MDGAHRPIVIVGVKEISVEYHTRLFARIGLVRLGHSRQGSGGERRCAGRIGIILHQHLQVQAGGDGIHLEHPEIEFVTQIPAVGRFRVPLGHRQVQRRIGAACLDGGRTRGIDRFHHRAFGDGLADRSIGLPWNGNPPGRYGLTVKGAFAQRFHHVGLGIPGPHGCGRSTLAKCCPVAAQRLQDSGHFLESSAFGIVAVVVHHHEVNVSVSGVVAPDRITLRRDTVTGGIMDILQFPVQDTDISSPVDILIGSPVRIRPGAIVAVLTDVHIVIASYGNHRIGVRISFIQNHTVFFKQSFGLAGSVFGSRSSEDHGFIPGTGADHHIANALTDLVVRSVIFHAIPVIGGQGTDFRARVGGLLPVETHDVHQGGYLGKASVHIPGHLIIGLLDTGGQGAGGGLRRRFHHRAGLDPFQVTAGRKGTQRTDLTAVEGDIGYAAQGFQRIAGGIVGGHAKTARHRHVRTHRHIIGAGRERGRTRRRQEGYGRPGIYRRSILRHGKGVQHAVGVVILCLHIEGACQDSRPGVPFHHHFCNAVPGKGKLQQRSVVHESKTAVGALDGHHGHTGRVETARQSPLRGENDMARLDGITGRRRRSGSLKINVIGRSGAGGINRTERSAGKHTVQQEIRGGGRRLGRARHGRGEIRIVHPDYVGTGSPVDVRGIHQRGFHFRFHLLDIRVQVNPF